MSGKEVRTEELVQLRDAIDLQIDVINQVAVSRGTTAPQIRSSDGSWPMTYLLSAKAQVLMCLSLMGDEEDGEEPETKPLEERGWRFVAPKQGW